MAARCLVGKCHIVPGGVFRRPAQVLPKPPRSGRKARYLEQPQGMHRLQHIAWPIVGLGAVAVSSSFLLKEVDGLSFSGLRGAIDSISSGRWLLAIGSTSLAYVALAWYDRLALLHLGRRISWPYVALASFTAAQSPTASALPFCPARSFATEPIRPRTQRRRDRRARCILLVHFRGRCSDARGCAAAVPSGSRRALRRGSAVARPGGRVDADRRSQPLFHGVAAPLSCTQGRQIPVCLSTPSGGGAPVARRTT